MYNQPGHSHSKPDKIRVSILERLVPFASLAIFALASGTGAYAIMRVLRALRMSENAGVSTVLTGLAEANIPVLIGFYIAVAVSFFGIVISVARLFMDVKTASPPGLFYVIPFLLALLPAGVLWYGESLILDVLYGVSTRTGSGGIGAVADLLDNLFLGTIIFSFVASAALFLAAFVPISATAGTRISSVIVVSLIWIVLIGVAAAFTFRTLSMYKWKEYENQRSARSFLHFGSNDLYTGPG